MITEEQTRGPTVLATRVIHNLGAEDQGSDGLATWWNLRENLGQSTTTHPALYVDAVQPRLFTLLDPATWRERGV